MNFESVIERINFSFITLSSIGLGDYALEPPEDKVGQSLVLVIIHALLMLLGLVLHSAFIAVGMEFSQIAALAHVEAKLAETLNETVETGRRSSITSRLGSVCGGAPAKQPKPPAPGSSARVAPEDPLPPISGAGGGDGPAYCVADTE